MTTAKPKELTDPACRNAKPRDKPWKLHDLRGLFLLVNPTGTKWWRLRYKLNGKDGLLSLGVYPDTPLAEARKQRDKARELIAQGISPAEARREERAATGAAGLRTFKVLAEQWFKTESAKWRGEHESPRSHEASKAPSARLAFPCSMVRDAPLWKQDLAA